MRETGLVLGGEPAVEGGCHVDDPRGHVAAVVAGCCCCSKARLQLRRQFVQHGGGYVGGQDGQGRVPGGELVGEGASTGAEVKGPGAGHGERVEGFREGDELGGADAGAATDGVVVLRGDPVPRVGVYPFDGGFRGCGPGHGGGLRSGHLWFSECGEMMGLSVFDAFHSQKYFLQKKGSNNRAG